MLAFQNGSVAIVVVAYLSPLLFLRRGGGKDPFKGRYLTHDGKVSLSTRKKTTHDHIHVENKTLETKVKVCIRYLAAFKCCRQYFVEKRHFPFLFSGPQTHFGPPSSLYCHKSLTPHTLVGRKIFANGPLEKENRGKEEEICSSPAAM